ISLDSTIVLLTPVVFATVTRLRMSPTPHVYACAHLANSASLLLPISNLTNLLAFRASGLTFAHFALLMALPTLGAIAVEWIVAAASDNGLTAAVRTILPQGDSFIALLGIAAVSAVLANLVNNLPAILILAPALAPTGHDAVLAALLGVNIGPNLTYVGSLAT